MAPLSKTDLLTLLQKLGISAETVDHKAAPTVETHTEAIRGIPQFKGGGQVKNLVLKAKSGKLFLIACMHDTKVDMKAITQRLGIKGNPMRMAAADIMQAALGTPQGSVTPFGIANQTAGGVALLLDVKFKACSKLLLHPLTNDSTTAISPGDFEKFVTSLGREVEYVDFAGSDQVIGACPEEPKAEEPKKKEQPKSDKPKREKEGKEPKEDTKRIPDMVDVPVGKAAGHPEGSITKCPVWMFKQQSWAECGYDKPRGF